MPSDRGREEPRQRGRNEAFGKRGHSSRDPGDEPGGDDKRARRAQLARGQKSPAASGTKDDDQHDLPGLVHELVDGQLDVSAIGGHREREHRDA